MLTGDPGCCCCCCCSVDVIFDQTSSWAAEYQCCSTLTFVLISFCHWMESKFTDLKDSRIKQYFHLLCTNVCTWIPKVGLCSLGVCTDQRHSSLEGSLALLLCWHQDQASSQCPLTLLDTGNGVTPSPSHPLIPPSPVPYETATRSG